MLSIVLFASCSANEGRFNISNESSFNIDSLTIIPDSKNKFVSLKKGEKIEYITQMNAAKSDGSYWIYFKKPNAYESIFQNFGYYTNGSQIEDVINIRILNDTILIESKFKNSIPKKIRFLLSQEVR